VPKKVHLRLTIDIEYTPNDEPVSELKRRLDIIPSYAAGEGFYTGDSTAEVDSWSHKVEEIQ
jgi:hypothetical protein